MEAVDALADPGFHSHRPATVERAETHASWVFLAQAEVEAALDLRLGSVG